MNDDEMNDDTETLRRALEDMIVEARARGWSRVVASAEHAAALWVTGSEDSVQADHPDGPEATRARLH